MLTRSSGTSPKSTPKKLSPLARVRENLRQDKQEVIQDSIETAAVLRTQLSVLERRRGLDRLGRPLRSPLRSPLRIETRPNVILEKIGDSLQVGLSGTKEAWVSPEAVSSFRQSHPSLRALGSEYDLEVDIPSPASMSIMSSFPSGRSFDFSSGSISRKSSLRKTPSSPLSKTLSERHIQRRTSLTANLLGAVPESEGVPIPLSPQVGFKDRDPSRDWQKERTHSDSDIRSKTSIRKIKSLREWCEFKLEAASRGESLDPGLLIDLDYLSAQAKSLALHLASRADSASALAWLLKEHTSPDDLMHQARALFIKHEIGRHREELFRLLYENMNQREPALSSVQNFDELIQVVENLHQIIDQFYASIRPLQIAIGTIGGGSALLGDGEDLEVLGDLIKPEFENLMSEIHQLLIQIEGSVIAKARLGLEKGDAELGSNFLKLLSEAQQESQEKDGQVWDFMSSDEAPSSRVAMEVSEHKQQAARIAKLVPGFPERDVTEMFQIGLPVDTADSEGNTLFQIALKQSHYGTALSLYEKGVDLSHQNFIFEPIALNQIKIPRAAIQEALKDYATDHGALWQKRNYQRFADLLKQSSDISMGQLMKILLNDSGEYEARSMKTLVILYLCGGPGTLNTGHGKIAAPSMIKEAIEQWCLNMIKMKLGLQKQGFEGSNKKVEDLVRFGLDHLNKPEGVAVLDRLFSIDSMEEIVQKSHSDEGLLRRLSQINLHNESKQDESKIEFRMELPTSVFKDSLERALGRYRREHCFVKFKANYQSVLELMSFSSQDLAFGNLLSVFYSHTGGWAQKSFKYLLAQELDIPGFEAGKIQTLTEDQALEKIHVWAQKKLCEKILGKFEGDLPRSKKLVETLLDKGLGYYGKFNGSKKATHILNALYLIDTRDLQGPAEANPKIFDLKILGRLQEQLKSKDCLELGISSPPVLARAFSAPRWFGKSSKVIDELSLPSHGALASIRDSLSASISVSGMDCVAV